MVNKIFGERYAIKVNLIYVKSSVEATLAYMFVKRLSTPYSTSFWRSCVVLFRELCGSYEKVISNLIT